MKEIGTVALIDLAQRRTDELFDEMRALVQGAEGALTTSETDGQGDKGWQVTDAQPTGVWREIERVDGESYRWPDGNVDDYTDFIVFEGGGAFDGLTLALGLKGDGEVVGFLLGPDGTAAGKRGLVYFQTADDFADSGELVSMIRGGGKNGRSGFAPTDPPPPIYGNFRTEALKGRKAGKWNVQAVVVGSDDFDAMLAHLAIQAKVRGLV